MSPLQQIEGTPFGQNLLRGCFVLGFSVMLLFYKNMLVLRFDGVENGSHVRIVALAVFCAAFACLGILALVRDEWAAAVCSKRPVVTCSCAFAAAGIGLSSFCVPTPLSSAVVGALSVALFLVVSTCAWARIVRGLPLREAFVLMLGAFAFSFVLGFARDASGNSPWLLASFPLVCGAAWLACGSASSAAGTSGEGWAAAGDPVDEVPSELPVLLVALYLASSLIRGVAIAGGGAGISLLPNTVLSLVSIALALLLAVLALRLTCQRFFYLSWLISSVLVFLGLFVLSLSVDGSLTDLGSDVVALGRLFIISLLFLFAAYRASTGGAGYVKAFARYTVLPYAVSVFFRDLLLSWKPGALASFSIAVEVCCFVLATLTVALTARALMRQAQRIGRMGDPGASGGIFAGPDVAPGAEGLESARPSEGPRVVLDVTVRSMAETYGLTKKEAETCGLLVRGYTLASIADVQCVSLNTVRSHYRAIYNKVGVHSRQELIELVEKRAR